MWSQTGVKDKWPANSDPESDSYVRIVAEWVVGREWMEGFSPFWNTVVVEWHRAKKKTPNCLTDAC